MDWQSVIAIGALLVAGVSFLARSFDKSLSIREHEEFRNSIRDQISQVRLDTRRDDDRLEDRIKVLETTRPTTGELEAKLGKGTS
jgi:acetylornithine deacetylase/succinyl-diaminopimelate desuccinylase-like protein